MALYVDSARTRANINGTPGRWSHLIADTTEELIQAAGTLGLDAQEIKDRGLPGEHLLVNDRTRSIALRNGATRLDAAGVATLIRRKAGES